MAYQLAQAYVQIVPSMKGVGKAIENAFDGPSKSTGQKAGQSIGSGPSVSRRRWARSPASPPPCSPR